MHTQRHVQCVGPHLTQHHDCLDLCRTYDTSRKIKHGNALPFSFAHPRVRPEIIQLQVPHAPQCGRPATLVDGIGQRHQRVRQADAASRPRPASQQRQDFVPVLQPGMLANTSNRTGSPTPTVSLLDTH